MSDGRPKIFHERILTGSPSVLSSVKAAEREIPLLSTNLDQSATQSYKIVSINKFLIFEYGMYGISK